MVDQDLPSTTVKTIAEARACLNLLEKSSHITNKFLALLAQTARPPAMRQLALMLRRSRPSGSLTGLVYFMACPCRWPDQ
jgi:hypothetical protein